MKARDLRRQSSLQAPVFPLRGHTSASCVPRPPSFAPASLRSDLGRTRTRRWDRALVERTAYHCRICRWLSGCRRLVPPTSSRPRPSTRRSEEHTSELQSLMRLSYAVFCLKKKKNRTQEQYNRSTMNTHHNTNK